MTRWRAELSDQYWFIGFGLKVVAERDTRTSVDDNWYAVGNYFSSARDARMAAECLKDVLAYIHGDNSLDNPIERLIVTRRLLLQERSTT